MCFDTVAIHNNVRRHRVFREMKQGVYWIRCYYKNKIISYYTDQESMFWQRNVVADYTESCDLRGLMAAIKHRASRNVNVALIQSCVT
jgi:hypothetical protein